MQGFGMNFKRIVDPNAPVSPGVDARYETLLQELGGNMDDYPLPELDVDARSLVEGMAAEYARLKEEDRLPATAPQAYYAGLIAEKLGLKTDFSERPTRNEVGAFIEAHREDYRLAFRNEDGSYPTPGR